MDMTSIRFQRGHVKLLLLPLLPWLFRRAATATSARDGERQRECALSDIILFAVRPIFTREKGELWTDRRTRPASEVDG